MSDIAEGEICLVAAAGDDDDDDGGALNSEWQQGHPTPVQTGLHWSPVVDTPLTLVLSCVKSVNHKHTHRNMRVTPPSVLVVNSCHVAVGCPWMSSTVTLNLHVC